MKLRRLQEGDKIGLIATGSAIDRERYEKGVGSIVDCGYEVVSPFDACGGEGVGFFAASAKTRAAGFMQLIEDKSVGAIISVRGGYGTQEVLPLLDYKKIAEAKKPIVGFSDFSSALLNISARAKVPTIHGPNLYQIAEFYQDKGGAGHRSLDALYRLLEDGGRQQYICKAFRAGESKGDLLAGNLCILCSLLGTPWDVSYEGKILAIEDVHEKPYRIHRMLRQLKDAGKFEKLAGVLFGNFSAASEVSGEISVQQVLESSLPDFFANTKYPVLSGAPLGHAGHNMPLVVGLKAEIKGEMLTIPGISKA